MARFLRATEMAHALVRERVREGERVVDATVGNGHDTVFLAGLVGDCGRVTGFDVQEEAVEATWSRLAEAGLEARAEVHRGSHATMAERVAPGVGAVMFNLGYLPGGERGVVTRPDSTVEALVAGLGLLRRGGIVTCVVYTGHEGGTEEAEAVSEWGRGLAQEDYSVVRWGFENQRNRPPFLLAVERKGG